MPTTVSHQIVSQTWLGTHSILWVHESRQTLEILLKITRIQESHHATTEPAHRTLCLLQELEIKPFTSIFNHRTTASKVAFFAPLKQHRTGKSPQGSGEDGSNTAFPNRYWNTICSGGLILLTPFPISSSPLKWYLQLGYCLHIIGVLLAHYPFFGKERKKKYVLSQLAGGSRWWYQTPVREQLKWHQVFRVSNLLKHVHYRSRIVPRWILSLWQNASCPGQEGQGWNRTLIFRPTLIMASEGKANLFYYVINKNTGAEKKPSSINELSHTPPHLQKGP